MNRCCAFTCFVLVILANVNQLHCQGPPRLAIPGAILLQQPGRPIPFRQQRVQNDEPLYSARVRRPNPAPIRPVVEETEDVLSNNLPTSTFDEEVSKLGLNALQSGVRQAEEERPNPIQFRPERPIPILRENIRENIPIQRPVQHLRQENFSPTPQPIQRPQQQQRQDNYSPSPRPIFRQEEAPTPVRHQRPSPQQVRQQAPQPAPQQYNNRPSRPTPIPRNHAAEEEENRTRKPPVQILRKYRTDNPDGSITWGYENEDGSFKEETLGIDCVTRGSYGYVDPDNVKREYSYETGNKCDPNAVEEEEEELIGGRPQQQQQQQAQGGRKPQYRPVNQQQQN